MRDQAQSQEGGRTSAGEDGGRGTARAPVPRSQSGGRIAEDHLTVAEGEVAQREEARVLVESRRILAGEELGDPPRPFELGRRERVGVRPPRRRSPVRCRRPRGFGDDVSREDEE